MISRAALTSCIRVDPQLLFLTTFFFLGFLIVVGHVVLVVQFCSQTLRKVDHLSSLRTRY